MPRDYALDLFELSTPASLEDLDAHFDTEEICQAVKRLPMHKAPALMASRPILARVLAHL